MEIHSVPCGAFTRSSLVNSVTPLRAPLYLWRGQHNSVR